MAAKPTADIRIQGLDQFRRDLRKISREARSEWDKELRAIGRPIAARSKEKYRELHPKRRGGRGSQRGIRSSARRGGSVLILGSNRYPYLAGQEFGTSHYQQFPEWNKRQGEFFYPVIREGRDEVFQRLITAVDRINAKYFRERP